MRQLNRGEPIQFLQVTDPRVVACLDGTTPDIGALWELCVYLEWDRKETVDGIVAWLGPPDGLRILDCACGSGFPGIDLAGRGYDITCSDGSAQMLAHFRRNAQHHHVAIEPLNLSWDELQGRFGVDAFDVVMCRGGGSLLYAGTWDDDQPPDPGAIASAIQQFVACLRPNGRLYVDITRAENLSRLEPQWVHHPRLLIGDHFVELKELITTDAERRIRVWNSWLSVNGTTYEFKRRSHHLFHDELVALLLDAGLEGVEKEAIRGENYSVFVARRPA